MRANRFAPEAIYYEEDVPGEWGGYVRASADFCIDLDSPNGARRMGKIGRDVPLVAQLPIKG